MSFEVLSSLSIICMALPAEFGHMSALWTEMQRFDQMLAAEGMKCTKLLSYPAEQAVDLQLTNGAM